MHAASSSMRKKMPIRPRSATVSEAVLNSVSLTAAVTSIPHSITTGHENDLKR
jgi:hypothetical protein